MVYFTPGISRVTVAHTKKFQRLSPCFRVPLLVSLDVDIRQKSGDLESAYDFADFLKCTNGFRATISGRDVTEVYIGD